MPSTTWTSPAESKTARTRPRFEHIFTSCHRHIDSGSLSAPLPRLRCGWKCKQRSQHHWDGKLDPSFPASTWKPCLLDLSFQPQRFFGVASRWRWLVLLVVIAIVRFAPELPCPKDQKDQKIPQNLAVPRPSAFGSAPCGCWRAYCPR